MGFCKNATTLYINETDTSTLDSKVVSYEKLEISIHQRVPKPQFWQPLNITLRFILIKIVKDIHTWTKKTKGRLILSKIISRYIRYG